MCWKLVEQALATNVRATARHVLTVLAHRANHETGMCFPAIARLVRDTGLSRRAVQQAVADLVSAGHISRFEDEGKGVRYFIHPEVQRGGTGAHRAPLRGAPRAGDAQTSHPTGASAAPEPEPTIIETSSDPAIEQAAVEILRLAGWPRSGLHLNQVHHRLQHWLRKGYELEDEIIAGIATAIQQRPGRTNSLKRFDVPIEQLHKIRTRRSGTGASPTSKDRSLAVGDHIAGIIANLAIS